MYSDFDTFLIYINMNLTRRIASFRYAFAGLADLFRTQTNARIHLIATACVLAAGWYFEVSRQEWLVLVLVITGVIAMEAVNTAIEYLTDLVSPQMHPLAGKAKDVAAGAVLVMAIGAVVTGLLVFGPKVSAVWS